MSDNPALTSWVALNRAVRVADENTCHQLLDLEKKDKRRTRFLMRIHSRLNKIRADRERRELMEAAIDRSRSA